VNWKKIILWALAAIIVLIAAIGITSVLLLHHSPEFRQSILARVEQSVEDSTGAHMQVKDFSLQLRTLTLDIYGIIVHGTEPAGSAPLAQADHLGVGIAIDSLLGRKWHFRNITLDHPVVQIAVNKAGENNLPRPEKQSSGSKTNLFDLGIRQMMLNRGEIYYNDQKTVLAADLHDLNVTVGYDPSQSRYQGHLSYDQGKLQYGTYAPVAHNLDAGFSATPQKFTLDNAELSAGASHVVLNATMENFNNPLVQANYTASLVAGEFAKILKNPSIPTGTVQLAGFLRYQAQPNKSAVQTASLWGMLTSPELNVRTPSIHTGIRNLSAKYRLENGDADVQNLHAELLGGRLEGKATVRDFSGAGSGKVEATLKGVSLDVLQTATKTSSLREAHLVGNISANAQASWAKSISNLIAHSDVSIQAALGQEPSTPLNGEIHADYAARTQQLALRQSYIKTPQTSINLDGKISELSQLQIRMHTNDLHELETLSANFMKASANGKPPAKFDLYGSATLNATVSGSLNKPQVQGHLVADNLRVKGSSWKSLRTDISANPSLVTLTHGELQAIPKGHFEFNLQTRLKQWAYSPSNPVAIELSAAQLSIADLERLAGQTYPLTGTLALNVSVRGSQLNPVGHGDLTITDAKLSGEPIQNVNMKFQGDGKALNTTLNVRLPAGSANAKATYYPESQGYQAQVQMTDLRLEKLQAVKAKNLQIKGGVNLNASGKGTLKKPELLATLEIPTLQVQKQTIQGIKLQTHVQNQVADIALDSDVAQTYVKGRGSVGIAAPYNTNFRLDTGRVAFAPLLALYAPAQAPDAGGETELHVFVKGPLQDKNRVEAHLEIPVLKANYKQLQIGAAKPIRVDYQGGVAVLEPTLIEGTGTSVQLEAKVPVNNPNAAMLLAKGTIDLHIAQIVSPDLLSKGLVRFDIDSRRYGATSNINGQIRLENASFRTIDAPVGLDEANGVITVTKQRMEVTSFQGKVGGGNVTIKGGVNYRPDVQFDLALAANQIRLRYPEGLRTVVDSNLTFTGNAQASTLGGSVKIQHISFTPDFDINTFADQFGGGGTSAPSPGFAQTVKMNVAIQSTSQMDLSSSQVSVRGSANLRLAGTAAEPVILGRTTLTGGEVFVAGNRYVLQNGTIDFLNPVRTDPLVNLQARTTINEYNIIIKVQGPVERLQTSFISDPALPPADVINLIARGQTLEQQAATPSQSLTSGAQSLLAKQVGSQISNRVAKFAGLSHVQIDPSLGGNNQDVGATIAVQQRVTSNLFVTFSTDVTSTQRQAIQLEYQLNRRWSVSTVRDQNGGYGADARYHKDF
jgi:translocation and assembly module TamB